MPVADDWRTTPLSTVDTMFTATQGVNWEAAVDAFFAERLSTDDDLALIPALNDVSHAQNLVDGQLVTFRCMVQDMFDPEFYLSTFELQDPSTGKSRLCTAKYRDVAPLGSGEINLDSEKTVNKDRLTLYCVNVPAETAWVTDGYRKAKKVLDGAFAGTSKQENRKKRNHEDEGSNNDPQDVEMADETVQGAASTPAETSAATTSDSKKAKMEKGEISGTPTGGSPCHSLNLPIPSPNGKACLVKLYDSNGSDNNFAVNDVVEFVGIVSLDPTLAVADEDDGESIFAQFNREENAARRPPPSLVPRLHVLRHRKLGHLNPGLPRVLPSTLPKEEQDELGKCRAELHSLLTEALLGDALVAEYLICHLVSKIYVRQDVLTLGKLALNVHGVPPTSIENYSKRLATLLQMLVCKAHYLPMTVDSFNKATFVPKKDYNANRLVSGLLQLSANTLLMLDETAMNPGQLNQEGLRNLTALGSLINWQRLEYDFSYHKIEFNTDVQCLVLSEGRSMLPCDCRILLNPSDPPNAEVVKSRFAAVGSRLNVNLLAQLRNYLTVASNLTFEMSEDAQQAVQDDFVADRQRQGEERLTAEALHTRLVLARLLCLSHGKSHMDMDVWKHVKEMEKQRRDRSAHLPPQQQQQQPSVMANGSG